MKSERKNLWLWASYDFANSIAFVSVLLYFGIWFIAEHGASDAWISASVAISTLLMLFALPILGTLSDRSGKRMPFLIICSLLCIGSLIALGFTMSMIENLTLLSTIVIIALYSCFNFFYNSCFTFYNAFVEELTLNGKTTEHTSGFGMGMGQVGNVIGLVLAIPLAQGKISLAGLSGKPLVLVASGLLFLLCSLPMFLYLKDKPQKTESVKLGRSIKETLRDLRFIRNEPDMFWYLVTYCLFADAMLTLSLFASSYLDIVSHMADTQKSITFILAAFSGIFGAFVSPLFVRLFGSCKRAISASIILWTIVLALFAITAHPLVLSIVVILNGFAFGALFALSRAFFAALIPEGKQAEMFGLYALFERTASVFGPLLWSGTAFLFLSFGANRYRFSVLALTILVLISWFTMQKVKEPEKTQ